MKVFEEELIKLSGATQEVAKKGAKKAFSYFKLPGKLLGSGFSGVGGALQKYPVLIPAGIAGTYVGAKLYQKKKQSEPTGYDYLTSGGQDYNAQ